MDKAKKKRIKKVITWVSLAAVVALLAAMPLIARQEAEADGPVASILSARAETGSLTSVIHGGGTVEAETVEEVKLPSGVKITGFLVKNGQFVEEGAALATLDKVSVMTAITEVSETLDYLRDELQSARDEKVASAVKATAGGRVKKVFAQKGESVQDVMLRDGCLAVLSLDGMMAVKLEGNFPVGTGERVAVTLADGKEITGRVESNLDGVLVLTVEDEGYEIGQNVTVSSSDGQKLGEGPLYIHNAWKATAYSGTVETVSAKEEKTLSSGATLFTLKDRDYEGELRHRANQHREYEQLLQELFRMYESGILTAPCAGEVEGVDEDSAFLLSAVPEGWTLAPLSNTVSGGEEKSWTVMLLSSSVKTCTQDRNCQLTWQEHLDNGYPTADCKALCQDCHENPELTDHAADCITWCQKAANPETCKAVKHYKDCIHSCTPGTTATQCAATKHHKQNCIESCKEADGVRRFCDATGDHKSTCIGACTKSETCKANPYHHADCIKKCNATKDCPANVHRQDCPHCNLTYTAEVGVVKQMESGTILYAYESAEGVPATKNGDSYAIGFKPDAKNMVNGVGSVPANGAGCKVGDIILIITGKDSGGNVVVNRRVYVYSSGSTGGMGGFSGFGGFGGLNIAGMIGGFGGFGNYGAAAPEEEPLFDLEGETLLTVIPHDKAFLVISVDEHDIAKLSVGMKATVKIEALKGQEFPAEITSIAQSGTNNGGSSKFAVELTLPMSEDMLPGMSASAVIVLEEKQDILLIPAAALTQQGAKTVVFTALDEKTGEPVRPVEVKTGLTDGDKVEILSGLTEGQSIYYSYYDTVELDTSAEADKYTLR